MTRRSRRLAGLGLGLLSALLLVALTAPWLAPYDPTVRVGVPFARPSAAHLLGTDDVGKDLLSGLIHGARVSLLVGVVAALSATVLGSGVGIVAGYARGVVDTAAMRLVDVVLSLPVLPLTIVVGVFAGPGLRTQIFVIAGVLWAGMARELRAQVLSLRERDHLQALLAMGARPWHVLPRHVLPAVAPLIGPQFVLATKTAILLEASLAFLGLGDLTRASWGTMLSLAHARSAFLTDAWLWWVLPPGLAIATTVLAFGLLGHVLEERTRPGLRDRPAAPRRDVPVSAPVVDTVDAALVISQLSVRYGDVLVVDGVSLTVAAGELVGLVGESGSGKSTIAGAALALLPAGATVSGGGVRVCGQDLTNASPAALRALRGNRVALIPQEANSALNPVLTVGFQLAETVRAHRPVGRAAVRARALELLGQVGLDPDRVGDYPHQLSGGMRQRVVIAMALAGDPEVLVADEPTSGLDVLVQADVLDLLDGLRTRLGLAMLVVSHDLPVIERVADRIAVLQAGRLVEVGDTATITTVAAHPCTQALLASAPRLRLPAGQVRR
ncbi:MAG: dipeptide/oligopeptide/nickel ABC transporter permease/ATP-binding protein [Actinobacteria bacterium]|nr:dipeptide/oligopeptide/nickel ABC transporter permease/ATP-binding protein [Actinomycetota bacterium]